MQLKNICTRYFFAFQIFCDFSGYSDIAIGAARIMGYDLMTNFQRPYFSKSIAEFWRRWHISLSTWFRDYVYIPLGGNRVSRRKRCGNLLIVFGLSGLWHGANWTFVVWGFFHGALLVLGSLLSSWLDRVRTGMDRALKGVYSTLCMVVTFHLVLVGWVFFRADSLADVGVLFRNATVLDWWRYPLDQLMPPFELLVGVCAIGFMEVVHLCERREGASMFVSGRPRWQPWILSYALFLAIVLFGKFNVQEFIYFQF